MMNEIQTGNAIHLIDARVTAAIVTGIFGLISIAVTIWVTQIRMKAARELADRQNKLERELSAAKAQLETELAEQKARLDERALFAAERVAKTLLNHADWSSRTFRIIKSRLGGFSDDELRQILVRSGAIRVSGIDEEERWGLLERNQKVLGNLPSGDATNANPKK